MENLENIKRELIEEINKRQEDKIIEKNNAEIIIKLIEKSENINEAIAIAELGTTYKRTGFHFDKRLEQIGETIKYLEKNEKLSFYTDSKQNTHKLIIGDNYEALQNLLVSYKNLIDVIYIDPPYSKDKMGEFANTNYNNDITRDNLLSMLYPRLILAKQLLSEKGVIICSIDDKNQAYVKCLFDEIFRENNFISCLPTIMNLKGNQDEFGFAGTHEYTLVYAKDISMCELGQYDMDEAEIEKTWTTDDIGYYKKGATLKSTGEESKREDRPLMFYPILYKDNKVSTINEKEFLKLYNKEENKFDDEYLNKLILKYQKSGYIVILPKYDEKEFGRWRWGYNYENIKKLSYDVICVKTKNGYSLYKKQRPDIGDIPTKKPKSLMYKPEYSSGNGTTQIKEIFGYNAFPYPKPVELIKDFIRLIPNKNAIVLDFFAGSGTTGQAVLELNKMDKGKRKFILCTNNEQTNINPNGVAYDVTSKRLKRIMTGECYDKTSKFEWANNNEPLGDNLDVLEIKGVSNKEQQKGKSAFEVIDECLYEMPKFKDISKKIEWICQNFYNAQKYIEKD